jgi:nitronate monooxygenase
MTKFQTSLCNLLNVDVPIIQAPMGRATNPALAAAISNAGAVGMLGMHQREIEAVRQLTSETRRLESGQ